MLNKTGRQMLNNRGTVVGFAVIGLMAVIVWQWTRSSIEPPPFDKVAMAQMELSIPPDADIVREFAIQRGRWSSTASWRFRSELSWDEFREWVRSRMRATYFDPDEEDEGHIEFRCHRSGETHSLTFERVSDEPPLLVDGQFVVYAD